MPTSSPAQHRFMEWISHDPSAAKQTGVPQSTAREMVSHDQHHAYMDAVRRSDAESMKRFHDACAKVTR